MLSEKPESILDLKEVILMNQSKGEVMAA